MDNTHIASLCKELLINHNRVSLGSMGAFVAQELPATLTRDSHILMPPSRRISFRSTETWNDGLLEEAFQDKGGYIKELHESIAAFAKILAKDKSLTLDGFGTLRSTKEGSIFFVIDKDVTLHPNGFGLVPLSLSPLENPSKIKCATSLSAAEADESEQQPQEFTQNDLTTDSQTGLSDGTTPTTISGAEVNPEAEPKEENVQGVIASVDQAQRGTTTKDIAQVDGGGLTEKTTSAKTRNGKWWVWLLSFLLVVMGLIAAVYFLREPLRPILEQLLYSAEERTLLP